jgi:hypothetical protein
MKSALRIVLLSLGLACGAAAAQALTANFQANCSRAGSDINCVFDANRPSTGPSRCGDGSFPTGYSWSFGDGTAPVSGSNAFVGHTYYAPLPSWYQIDLTVSCASTGEQSVTVTRYLCLNFGGGGCIAANGTWN